MNGWLAQQWAERVFTQAGPLSSIRGGRADTPVWRERRRVLGFSVMQGQLLPLHSSTPALLTSLPSSLASIMALIPLAPFPSPIDLLEARCVPRPFRLYFTAVNVTWVTLSCAPHRRPFIRYLFKRTPTHISCFLIFTTCQRALFLPFHSAVPPYFICECQTSFPCIVFLFFWDFPLMIA